MHAYSPYIFVIGHMHIILAIVYLSYISISNIDKSYCVFSCVKDRKHVHLYCGYTVAEYVVH